MFQDSGLSLEQAPPIKVVLRFFLTGAIFGVVASVMLFFWHDNLSNISSASTLAFVHTLTLGVMASFMLGALFQMMPVVCGVHIKAPIDLSLRVNYALILGVIFLVVNFFNISTILYYLSAISLMYALLSATYTMAKELVKIEHSSSSKGMLLAVIALALTAIFGLLLITMREGFNLPFNYLDLKTIHYSFGLYGWISLLLISVSFQVIEMFYVTPKYNNIYAKNITTILFTLLIAYTLLTLFSISFANYIAYFILIILLSHSIYTLINLKRKKRPVNDATVYFWVLSMFSLVLFSISNLLNNTTLSATLFTIFALSVVFAMVYKIVPFLVWFHLNAKGYFDAPMMHEVIHPKYAKNNFWLFLLASLLSIGALFFTKIYYIVSILWLLSFFMLLFSIYSAWHKYLYTLENGKKFNFPSM